MYSKYHWFCMILQCFQNNFFTVELILPQSSKPPISYKRILSAAFHTHCKITTSEKHSKISLDRMPSEFWPGHTSQVNRVKCNNSKQRCCSFKYFHQNKIGHEFIEQDPVSTIQKVGWTIHSSFLVLSGLKKSFTLDLITRGQSTTIFLCIGPFSAWWQTTDRTTGWS